MVALFRCNAATPSSAALNVPNTYSSSMSAMPAIHHKHLLCSHTGAQHHSQRERMAHGQQPPVILLHTRIVYDDDTGCGGSSSRFLGYNTM